MERFNIYLYSCRSKTDKCPLSVLALSQFLSLAEKDMLPGQEQSFESDLVNIYCHRPRISTLLWDVEMLVGLVLYKSGTVTDK